MIPDDPDDAPTRPLSRSGSKTRFVFGDDDAPTARIATKDSEAPRAEQPRIAAFESDHVVTRRISSPRRQEPAPQPVQPRIESQKPDVELPTGWVVVVAGPGRGRHFPVLLGMNSLGRDDANSIPLNLGDEQISRKDHCFIVFDDEQATFWIQHGGKSNLVRVNDTPVLSPVKLKSGDFIRLGASKLRFVALCDRKFNWAMSQ